MFLLPNVGLGMGASFLRVSGGVSDPSQQLQQLERLSPRERRCFLINQHTLVGGVAFSA